MRGCAYLVPAVVGTNFGAKALNIRYLRDACGADGDSGEKKERAEGHGAWRLVGTAHGLQKWESSGVPVAACEGDIYTISLKEMNFKGFLVGFLINIR
eukprot:709976-Amorphochlora_amoeboformis.AAC.1